MSRAFDFYDSLTNKGLRDKHDPFTVLYPSAAAHAIKNIASGASSPAGRRPCDQKHRTGRSFPGGPAPMRSKTSHRALFPRRAGAHAIKNIASGALSPAGRRPCDQKHRIGRTFPAGRRPCDQKHRIRRIFPGGPAMGTCDAYLGIVFTDCGRGLFSTANMPAKAGTAWKITLRPSRATAEAP